MRETDEQELIVQSRHRKASVHGFSFNARRRVSICQVTFFPNGPV